LGDEGLQSDPATLPECDLVMKGGITSGVVYPGIVLELGRTYRFRSIGGTSAGAIAAAICAAAEYGRQGRGPGGMPELEKAVEDLRQDKFLLSLFQPTPEARPLFEAALAAATSTGSKLTRFRELAISATQRRPAVGILAIVLGAGLALLQVAAFRGFSLPVALLLLLITVPLFGAVMVGAGLASIVLLLRSTYRSLSKSHFGVCPGIRQEGYEEQALVEWLDDRIQACAGLPSEGPPLTVKQLADRGIELRMMTTDLSFGRPVVMPHGLAEYMFSAAEMRTRFPERVVAAMLGGQPPDRYALVREEELPVVVAARLSLSFPGLLSAMPLYLADPDTGPDALPHLFSDGGIASNFPLQFFDSWFPGRPTFGVDLADHPAAGDDVFMLTDPSLRFPPRWKGVTSVGGFAGQIKDTMQNWRDSMQMQLPGYRDRVCQVRLHPGEGGLHIYMPPELIDGLIDRGHAAGRKILETFDGAEWDRHRCVRYLVLMQMLQENLHGSGESLEAFAPRLAEGFPDFTYPRDAAWCALGWKATSDLLELSRHWGAGAGGIDFEASDTPLPKAVMRVVPNA
jgi:predicted acylesterase/phospholipase RssA